ncbi:GNAT family N-acetyltransferase [Boseongicola sp. H5]|uniref:GNAT family N-acetyltransferase n=2 Tax=Paracoccaceae TaxID=31989 RepID=UPI001D09C173|nr:GNAT family N-acetyltransferase [Boseongicola sp. H5]
MAGDCLRAMAERDLDLVREWRNHDTVRLASFSTALIDRDEHLSWFHRVQQDQGHEVCIAEAPDGQPFGVVQFRGALADGLALWGFYVAPGSRPGLGRRLGALALGHAFDHRGWHRLEGRVRAGNDASRRFHSTLGFRQEGRLRDAHRTDMGYEDVMVFGLLATEWRARERKDRDDENND